MSSETITRNDLKAILDSVLPNPNITTIIGEALTTTVANTTKTNTSRITLPKGTWFIIFQSAINVGSSKQFQSSIVINSVDVAAEQGGGALTGLVRHNLSWVCTIREPTTIYGAMYHNSGSTLTINTNDMIAIQLYSALSTTLNDIADYIVEQGTSGVWIYRKWNSGIAECWGTHKYTLTGWATWGTLYEGSSDGGAYYQESYPNNLFTARPFSIATVQGIGKGYLLETYNAGDATKTDGYIVVRPNNTGSLGDVYINIHAIGRWK